MAVKEYSIVHEAIDVQFWADITNLEQPFVLTIKYWSYSNSCLNTYDYAFDLIEEGESNFNWFKDIDNAKIFIRQHENAGKNK